ncbi:DEAD/DEAH box helicase family protein [Sorangium sp. So ce388]|uniref:DEAD/DEAH box helicase family protein n=1 Tax=Sorangium sp. So ce388 TaxID=3133309 RepID=UPI003F5B29F5
MQLRPYQERAVQQVLEYAVEHINGRILLVVPGGGGKTLIGATLLRTMAVEQGLRGLAWAHRRELVDGMYEHLVECGVPRELLGVVMAGDPRRDPAAPIQVASVDTLHHRDKPPADLVISDEAHRDASDGRRKLRGLYPDALHVGLTATPCRLDGRGLGREYDTMIVVAQPSELIADGHLAPAPRIFTVPPELLPELKGVKVSGGDYEIGELERATNRRTLVGSIVSEWQRLAEGRRTMVFPVGLKHSRAIVARFRAAGIAAEHLDGETPRAERRKILEALAAGTMQVVSSCGVLSEGVNVPAVKCVVMARPTKSLALMIQQASRAMRPWEGVRPLILDNAGNVVVQGHGLPHADREWSRTSRRGGGPGQAPAKACKECNAVVPAGCAVCPECGSAFTRMPAMPTETEAELEEYYPGFTKKQITRIMEEIARTAEKYNAGNDWIERVFRVRVGVVHASP